jgi:hypothetical protein
MKYYVMVGEGSYPVIHDSLVEALKAAGVDNLELFLVKQNTLKQ